ncbi:hypothetical protein DRW41_22400 [Neobacillus piezotolerans]|uniref:NADH:quinone oxidoreductase/Mrp antiporter transmembrane domain-containing protein n=1 Tax=Neobacillus piezotolerans TaxID=2259171 RepID=A0A3D8GJZ9_9BACI|nr:hypothetical protein DRW41_22400 [Neobacillus piezotolerans]
MLMLSELLTVVVILLGGFSLVVGVFGVFNQVRMRAVLGYSSVFHIG